MAVPGDENQLREDALPTWRRCDSACDRATTMRHGSYCIPGDWIYVKVTVGSVKYVVIDVATIKRIDLAEVVEMGGCEGGEKRREIEEGRRRRRVATKTT